MRDLKVRSSNIAGESLTPYSWAIILWVPEPSVVFAKVTADVQKCSLADMRRSGTDMRHSIETIMD